MRKLEESNLVNIVGSARSIAIHRVVVSEPVGRPSIGGGTGIVASNLVNMAIINQHVSSAIAFAPARRKSLLA